MITSSFIFIPGIGKKTERYLWEKGILSWDDFKKANVPLQSRNKRRIIEKYLEIGMKSLYREDASFFARHLPPSEYWRLYKDFHTKTLFLDIETTGLSLYYDVITIIGTFDGRKIKFFVRDNNLWDIIDYMKNYEIIVTFNGKLFDIPFLKKEIPEIKIPPVHIDLRFLLKSIGMGGSLKSIEREIGIRREADIDKIAGREASILWNRFMKGNDKAFKRLVLYNMYDVINLASVMEFCYWKKVEKDILHNQNNRVIRCSLFYNSVNKESSSHNTPSNFIIPEIDIKRSNSYIKLLANRETLLKINRRKIRSIGIKIKNLIGKIERNGHKSLSVGIDLSGSEKRISGICILDKEKAYLKIARTDEEIIAATMAVQPSIISIDSPLSLPAGRCCIMDSCTCRQYGILRECERILKKRGVNIYPCLIKSMQKLTARGIKLAQIFEKYGFQVIESYPGAAQDILRFPRKRIDLKELKIDLINMGIEPFSDNKTITHDEIDALTSALVGYFYLAGMYEAIGNTEEGYLIIPDLGNGGK